MLTENDVATVVLAILNVASRVTHVVVDSAPIPLVEPFYKQDRFWVGAGAVASALVAIFTYILGRQTRTVATETQKLATATNTVAQETQNLVSATAKSVEIAQQALDASERRHQEGFQPRIAIEYRDYHLPPTRDLRKAVYLRNVGRGTAANVLVNSTNIQQADIRMQPVPSSLAAGDEAIVLFKYPQPSVDIQPITVAYEDVFGNKFESKSDGSTIIEGVTYTFQALRQR